MLFNSLEFVFLFLPITIVVYFLFNETKSIFTQNLSIIWLVIASLFFDAWWNSYNLPLIIASIIINYIIGYILGHKIKQKTVKKLFFLLGISLNLGLIGYFKYANFLVDNLNYVLNIDLSLPPIILPLAISFFTFQQIAYLVDAYKGETKEYSLLKYTLFVCFFPQLIAGPIVHHKDILPQFSKSSTSKFNSQTLAVGLTIFMAGLFKKVVFADSIAEFANLAFNAAANGVNLTFSEAWAGSLAYTLQLYFDFSGYSDMAIGAAFMFGIRLPLNFNSPYKAISISDFWRRWHITLSNFLRDYLYIPLGGSRQGNIRRYSNLMITMLLGGLWHGAGWTFIFWGGLHGAYLVVNHLWRSFRQTLGHDLKQDSWWLRGMGWSLTFIAVVISWVFFRASNFETAISIIRSMSGFNGINLPNFFAPYLGFLRDFGVEFRGFTVQVGISQKYAVFGIALLLSIAWFAPNTQQWMGHYNPTLTKPLQNNRSPWSEAFWQKLQWQPNRTWTTLVAGLTVASLLCFTRVSEFLYFQF